MILDTCLSGVDEFFEVVEKSELLEPETLEAWKLRSDLPDNAKALATLMVKEGAITLYQGNRLLQGKFRGFNVGPYKILNMLSEGKTDAVFLAEHLAMDRYVALKVVKQNLANDRVTHERFQREARITANLNHPNIVKVYDFAEENGLQYLIMEYVEGKTLQNMLNTTGPLAPEQAVDYVRQVLKGLEHAHNQGIIHRDMKPSNIIVDKSGKARILDMGHSRFSDDEKMNITKMYDPNSVVGTVEYISPEQTMGDQYDHRCDIYSLGVTLYTLIAGTPPFQGSSYQVLMAHQMEEVPSLKAINPAVPSALQAVINKMMAKQPDGRFQSADEVMEALQRISLNRSQVKVPALPKGQVPIAKAPSQPPAPTRPSMRKPSTPSVTFEVSLVEPVKNHRSPSSPMPVTSANYVEKQPKRYIAALIAGGAVAGLLLCILIYKLL